MALGFPKTRRLRSSTSSTGKSTQHLADPKIKSRLADLGVERTIVKPAVIVTLGATAARSVLGRLTTITALRGRPVPLGWCYRIRNHPPFGAPTDRRWRGQRAGVRKLRCRSQASGESPYLTARSQPR